MPWLSNNSTILYFFFCSWLSILLMLSYMGTVIVILLNILIAQMSTTYTQAKKVARLEYDVDRISLLTRMERFPFLVSKWQRTEIEFWNVLSQEDCSPSCSLVFWVRECTRVCRVLVKTGLSFFCCMLNVHYAKNVSSRRLGLRQRNSAVGILFCLTMTFPSAESARKVLQRGRLDQWNETR